MFFGLMTVAVLILCREGFGREPQVQVVRDVSYLGEGRQEKMDLYLPAVKTNKPRRTIPI